MKARVLVLTSRYPYPVVGGDRLRIYEICRHLSSNHSLTLLSLCASKAELEGPLPTDGVFSRIERIYLPRWRSILNTLGALPSRSPLQVAYYRSSAFASKVRELLPHHDCCIAHLIRTAEYVKGAPIPTLLEMTDAMSLHYSRARVLYGTRRVIAAVYGLEYLRLVQYEKRLATAFPAVSLVSEVDRQYLLSDHESESLIVCSNGVDTEKLPFIDRRGAAPVVAFIGTLTAAHNLDACLFFATEVLPLLRRQIDCRFRVVGRINARDIKRLAKYPGVDVYANVPNIATAVSDASIGVAPIRVGAGVKNKILEYMALGLPVVTSPMGLEGLSARPGSHVLVASSPQQYVECIMRLWQSPDLAFRMAQLGHEYVTKHHSWRSTLAPLVQAIDTLAAAVKPDHSQQGIRSSRS